MIDLKHFATLLSGQGIEFITGVPDTLLNDFCLYIEEAWPSQKHIVAANEGNAIALATGYHLATDSIPLVYMQNSGIGNAVNPLVSLSHPDVYSIPMILLIGWRGEPGRKDHPQHTKQGELTPVLMEDMDIPYRNLKDNEGEVEENVHWAMQKAREISGPVALLVTKGILEKGEKDTFEEDSSLLSREEAIRCVVESLDSDAIFVASTGRATRELFETRRLMNGPQNQDFLNVGAMGHTSSIAAGIALGNPEKKVVCLEGDASAIMHMGSMAIIGQLKHCKNLMHIILNNGAHESVGGQPSVGNMINFDGIAQNMGYAVVGKTLSTADEIQQNLKYLSENNNGPCFLEIKIKKGMRKDMPVLKFDLDKQKKALKISLHG